MRLRFRPWHLALLVIALCAGIVALAALYRIRANLHPRDLVLRFPPMVTSVAYIDVAALRAAGLLDQLERINVSEETEYRDFVVETGFDFVEDLDAVLVGFLEAETLLLLRGRFDWARLTDYVQQRSGICYNGLCRLPGSRPDRLISFFAVSPRVMAMAISADDTAAVLLSEPRPDAVQFDVPNSPVWASLAGSTLARSEWLPAGTRSFASAMEKASRVTFALGPAGTDFEGLLEVECETAPEARRLAGQLTSVTEMLRSLIRREDKHPNHKDLSGVLTGGAFRCDGERVHGRWPIRREFVEAVTAGTD